MNRGIQAQLINEILEANLEPYCDIVSGSVTGKCPPPMTYVCLTF